MYLLYRHGVNRLHIWITLSGPQNPHISLSTHYRMDEPCIFVTMCTFNVAQPTDNISEVKKHLKVRWLCVCDIYTNLPQIQRFQQELCSLAQQVLHNGVMITMKWGLLLGAKGSHNASYLNPYLSLINSYLDTVAPMHRILVLYLKIVSFNVIFDQR
jgi:hypothetical protein